MIPGLLILVTFLILAGLMMTRKMPALIALPFMAIAVGTIAGLFAHMHWSPTMADDPNSLRIFLFKGILTDGASLLKDTMMYAIFGSILSQVVMRQGIAQHIVRMFAEFAGDRKVVLAVLITAGIAVAFLVLTGFGAAVMVGSLAMPIMIGAGISPRLAGCLMLFGISVGGSLNFVNLGYYHDVLKLSLDTMKPIAIAYAVLLTLATLIFLAVASRGERRRHTWALDTGVTRAQVSPFALLTPLLPIGLIAGLGWDIDPAFLAGILYGLATTEFRRLIPNLTACVLEGLKDISPVLGLFIGIGMVLAAMRHPATAAIMAPLLQAITPHTPLGFLLFFTLLAPLGLYRGPLNFYGLGVGIAVLMKQSGLLSPMALLAGFFAVGQVQGVCDPTNTTNVWVGQFTHVSPEDLMKSTLPYVWGFVLVALLYAVFIGGVFH